MHASLLKPRLGDLLDRLRRLKPSSRDPEAYFVEKDGIERDLQGLIEGLDRDREVFAVYRAATRSKVLA